MKNIIDKLCILELNKSWIPIGLKTPKKVFENFMTGNFLALHLDWSEDDIKAENYSSPTDMRPMKWEEWIEMPVRPYDMSIKTPNKEIRIPNIVICASYNKIPNITPKLTKKNIMVRDNYTCQFTGKKYDRAQLNIDHVIPKSKGGTTTWENLVTSHKDANTKKRNRTPEEAGMPLIRKPYKPTSSGLLFASKIRDPKWDVFLKFLS
jgi:5-methylcytosine-specific restriction endonuclease McrA